MSKIHKFLIFIFSTCLIVFYQNCGELTNESITELSEGITGTESINGDIFVLDSDELDQYLAQEREFSNFSEQIPTTDSAIESARSISSPSSSAALNYLCMISSEDGSSTYYPLAFDDYNNVSSNGLVPICMAKSSCLNYVSELGAVKTLESNLCKQNTLAKKFDSGEVLQLIKRY